MPDPPGRKAHEHPHKAPSRAAAGPASRDARLAVAPDSNGHGRLHAQPAYAELAVTTNFTFLTGASHPDEMVERAAAVGHRAVAITDHNSLAGIVRAHVAARDAGIPLAVGARLRLTRRESAINLDPIGADDRAAPEPVEPVACEAKTPVEDRRHRGSWCHKGNRRRTEPALDDLSILAFATDRASYGRLCRLLTLGKRRAAKGRCLLTLDDLLAAHEGLLAVVLVPEGPPPPDFADRLRRLRAVFDEDRLSLAAAPRYGAPEREPLHAALALSRSLDIPLAAVNDVYYHDPQRRALCDVLTCIRHGCTLDEAGLRLQRNAERSLKSPAEMERLFAGQPRALARSVEVALRAAAFDLGQLRYEYPTEVCPPGLTPMRHLRHLTWQGARMRYPAGVPDKVHRQIEHEFKLIEELQYAPYFLTVRDLVQFARSRGILCQGRGAAANSAVCFCLGVTSVDPDRIDILFERFVSRERNEPPDIDIDFEHERREEVIQFIYEKYGRDRAGLTAEVISYRGRSAIRDVGKALGFSLDMVDRLAKNMHHWEEHELTGQRSECGGRQEARLAPRELDRTDPTVQQLIQRSGEIIGFPRHLSQHVGGFVITRGLLSELVPIENAAMPERTVIEWDKDDIDALGVLKVDVLGLGMLTCIRKGLELIERHEHKTYELATIPAEDPAVYDMICEADTLGVFQIESRAQMTMLPRLKPRCFYDLVIEVAIVRPGPIVGDMVHPFLRRRNGEEVVEYPDEKVRAVLAKTLGVPLFQEQAMALAIVAAGFTPGEAEMLRRTISAWKSRGKDAIPRYRKRFIDGMLANGYGLDFATQCFERLKGFSEYGFPESHAASFALLVYASCWIKRYYPAAYAAALLNSQPMGFYAPAQIVRDAQDHGVVVLPVDVNASAWDCTLEGRPRAVRLGMRMVRGLREADAAALSDIVRSHGPFQSVEDLWHASGVPAAALQTLAFADAFASMGLDRQHAVWEVQALEGRPRPLFRGLLSSPPRETLPREIATPLPLREGSGEGLREEMPLSQPLPKGERGCAVPLPKGERGCGSRVPAGTVELPPIEPVVGVVKDYQTVGLSLKAHPVSFLRARLCGLRVLTAGQVKDESRTPAGRFVRVAGLVLFRQRPATARGVLFMTLEDETGRCDLILRPWVYERDRSAALQTRAVLARGRVERQGRVVHVLPSRLEDISDWWTDLPGLSRDFR